jgi:lipoprotein-anchoring transpeptidase ErfK/SrfK
MQHPKFIRRTALVGAVALLAALTFAPSAVSEPDDSSAAGDPTSGEKINASAVAPPFIVAGINPSDGSTVGVAKPIIINFTAPVANRAMAEDAIRVTSEPAVPGKFYWTNDTQLRWRPLEFWPAHTAVRIDAAGTTTSFTTRDALIAHADNATHQLVITRDGNVEQLFPMSMGKPGHDTPNGTYYVQDKFYDVVMDSETYGVPNDSPEGYLLHVRLAVQLDNSGNFVHSAPWSVSDQGVRNVSHGCINISPENAKWFHNNFDIGDPIIVTNSVGEYTQSDGGQDWQI